MKSAFDAGLDYLDLKLLTHRLPGFLQTFDLHKQFEGLYPFLAHL